MRALLIIFILAFPISNEIGQCAMRRGIVEYIAKGEGFHKPGTLPARLHNPGSLKYRGQAGAKRGVRGFASFPSDAIGWSALERDVAAKIRRHVPLHKGWDYL